MTAPQPPHDLGPGHHGDSHDEGVVAPSPWCEQLSRTTRLDAHRRGRRPPTAGGDHDPGAAVRTWEDKRPCRVGQTEKGDTPRARPILTSRGSDAHVPGYFPCRGRRRGPQWPSGRPGSLFPITGRPGGREGSAGGGGVAPAARSLSRHARTAPPGSRSSGRPSARQVPVRGRAAAARARPEGRGGDAETASGHAQRGTSEHGPKRNSAAGPAGPQAEVPPPREKR